MRALGDCSDPGQIENRRTTLPLECVLKVVIGPLTGFYIRVVESSQVEDLEAHREKAIAAVSCCAFRSDCLSCCGAPSSPPPSPSASSRSAIDSSARHTSTPAGKMVFTVLGAVAELERSLIVERVRAGLRNARAKGKRLGRPPKDLDTEKIAAPRRQGISWRAIPGRRTQQKALLQLEGLGAGERRRLDVDRDKRRNARAHGAVWLSSRSRGLLSGRELWLAEVHRWPRTSCRRAAITSASKKRLDPESKGHWLLDYHRDPRVLHRERWRGGMPAPEA